MICGHAHLYQRVVRQDTGQDIPYVLTGAGGYAITPSEEVGKSYMAQLTRNGLHLANKMYKSGYVRATVTSPSNGDPTLRFEYHSVEPSSTGPDDVCTVNLPDQQVGMMHGKSVGSRSSPGSLAMLAAMRRASSRVSQLGGRVRSTPNRSRPHSITSSAPTSSEVGISIPSVFALLRLMVSLIVVGW